MSSHAGKTTFFTKNTSKIIPKILPKSVQNTSKMVPKSRFGGVLGPCGGVLEPSGPENPPGCILGCENHVRGSPLGDAFWYNSGVFLCFFLLSFRPCAQNGILWIFMRFWAYFRLHFLSFLQQGGSRLFCNPSKQNHDFRGSRASIFQCFFPIFSTFHSGPHFFGFFNDFRVAKAPVLELVGLIFRHQKKSRKRVCGCLRLYASIRDPGRGGVPLKKITIPAETAVQHQCTPAVPEGTVADYFRLIHGLIASF